MMYENKTNVNQKLGMGTALRGIHCEWNGDGWRCPVCGRYSFAATGLTGSCEHGCKSPRGTAEWTVDDLPQPADRGAGADNGPTTQTEPAPVRTSSLPKTPKQHALQYVKLDIPVFPLHSVNEEGVCSCGQETCNGKNRGKHPRTRNGLKDATTDEKQINRWWDRSADANIGIRTGSVSGIFVLDVDGPEGEQSLRELEEKYGKLPDTPTVKTGRGQHRYFRIPAGKTIPNSASKIGHHLDIRGDGGYVVAPPSIHYTGNQYMWEICAHPDDFDEHFTEAAEWLVKLTLEEKTKTTNGKVVKKGKFNLKKLVLHSVSEGVRDQRLFEYACSCRARNMDRGEAEAVVEKAAALCDPPFPEEEWRQKLDQG